MGQPLWKTCGSVEGIYCGGLESRTLSPASRILGRKTNSDGITAIVLLGVPESPARALADLDWRVRRCLRARQVLTVGRVLSDKVRVAYFTHQLCPSKPSGVDRILLIGPKRAVHWDAALLFTLRKRPRTRHAATVRSAPDHTFHVGVPDSFVPPFLKNIWLVVAIHSLTHHALRIANGTGFLSCVSFSAFRLA